MTGQGSVSGAMGPGSYQLTADGANIDSAMPKSTRDTALDLLKRKADEAALMLSSMANAKRLLVLCYLVDGERSVGDLAAIVGLSPAALSQHLAKMRALDLVATRREAQTIYYSLASAEVREVLQTLYRIYCAPACAPQKKRKSHARSAA